MGMKEPYYRFPSQAIYPSTLPTMCEYNIGGSGMMIRRSDVVLNLTRMTHRVYLSHNATDK